MLLTLDNILRMLSAHSTVMVQELASNSDLIALIKKGKGYEELLEWVNASY